MAYTQQQYVDAIRLAIEAGDNAAANELAEEAGRLFPEGYQARKAEAPFDLSPSAERLLGDIADFIPDPVTGAAETALTLATGATGGTLGMMGGTIEGIGKSILEGKYGTQQGATEAQETAMKRAGQLTYQPRSETGQQYVGAIDELTENIPVVPVLAPELAAVRAAMRSAQNVPMSMTQVRTKVKDMVASKRPDIQVYTPEGQLTPEAINVIRQNNLESEIQSVITPEQAETLNLFQKYGIKPVRSDITQDVDDQRAKMDALKREGPVVQAVAEQERRSSELYEDKIDEFTGGGGTDQATDVATGNEVFKAIDDFAAKADEEISGAYNAARERAGPEGRVVSLDNLVLAVRSNKGKDTQSGGVVSAMQQELINKGVARLDDNGNLVPIQGANRLLTVDDVEDIRKYSNVLFQSARGNKGATDLIGTFKNLMDDSVERAVGEDLFKTARAEKTKYENTIARSRKSKRDKSRANLLLQILESRVEPDKIPARLISAGIDDFKGVIKFLRSDEAGQAGRIALDNIKANYLRRLLETARKGGTVGGEGEIKFTPMMRFVDKLKKNGQFDVLFSEAEKQFINDMLTIAKARDVDRSVAQGSGPSGEAIQRMMDKVEAGVIGQLPPIVGQSIGALLRGTKGQLGNIKENRRLLNVERDIERNIRESVRQSP